MSLPDGQRTIGPHFVADADLAGLLFDCDGTLIDSMSAWLPSWQYACGQYGLEMTESKFWGFAGVPLPDIVRSIYAEAHGGERAPPCWQVHAARRGSSSPGPRASF